MKSFIATLAVLLAACSCNPWVTTPPLPDPDYEVYRAILEPLVPTGSDSLPVLETLGPFPLDTTTVRIPSEYAEPFHALLTAGPRQLRAAGLSPLRVRVVPFGSYRALRTKPDSVLTLSRVGFSTDSLRAVVYLSAACRLCGTSFMTFLRRECDRWVPSYEVIWMADSL